MPANDPFNEEDADAVTEAAPARAPRGSRAAKSSAAAETEAKPAARGARRGRAAEPEPEAEAKPAGRRGARGKSGGKSGGDGFDTVDDEGKHVAGTTSKDLFSTSSGSSEFKVPDFLELLVLVRPTELIDEMDTDIGTAEDVIRGDVVALDGEPEDGGPEIGKVYEDVLFFQTALKRTLLRVFNGPNEYQLGWITMGKAAKGKSAPYIFDKPDDADKELARQWIKENA